MYDVIEKLPDGRERVLAHHLTMHDAIVTEEMLASESWALVIREETEK